MSNVDAVQAQPPQSQDMTPGPPSISFTHVLAGGSPATTVAAERAENPFLYDLRGDAISSLERSDPS
jgi:hypothetical protein